MTREWEPGDVAMVRLATRSEAEFAIFDGAAWTVRNGMTADPIEEPRPVVVIDPEDREQVESLVKAAWPLAALKRELADALQIGLRKRVDPPKPDEPTGWGAVVEDNSGAYWTLIAPEAGAWRNHAEGARVWSEIAAVRVVTPGVTA